MRTCVDQAAVHCRRGRLRLTVLWVLFSLLVAVIPILYWSWLDSESRTELDAIAALGEPTDIESVREHHQPQQVGADATRDWLDAMHAASSANPELLIARFVDPNSHSDWDRYFDQIVLPNQPWSDHEALSRISELLSDANELATRAASNGGEISFGASDHIDMNEAESLRLSLSLATSLAIYEERIDDAAVLIRTLLSAARMPQSDPTWSEWSIRCAYDAVKRLPWILSDPNLSSEHLATIARELSEVQFVPMLRSKLLLERASVIESPALIEYFGTKAHRGKEEVKQDPSSVLFGRMSLSAYLAMTRELLTALKSPPLEVTGSVSRVVRRWKNQGGMVGEITLTIASRYEESTRRYLFIDAQVRMAEAAVAIRRFIAIHHSLPESLEELVPDYVQRVPADPYDLKPIRYVLGDEDQVRLFFASIDRAVPLPAGQAVRFLFDTSFHFNVPVLPALAVSQ